MIYEYMQELEAPTFDRGASLDWVGGSLLFIIILECIMGDTWIIDMTHFLNEDGMIEPSEGPARRLAEHVVAIVSMASRPEITPPPEYRVRCRRRPGRKPCTGLIEVDLDPETESIVWWCPVCRDNGYISNWKGTLWDLSEADKVQ